ncbi:MAG: toll/interleukin-1 receptor domain-containing protein [Lachnospiraceae bacterium]|nr:toll/interleukin-1 receptor domain-containing protein [Lachnospiraceae bacterium]
MKEKLITLIDKTEEIETLFHKSPSSPGVIVPVVDEISDIQEFQLWIQELILEIQEIVDRTEDKYAVDTLAMLSNPFNGWRDRQEFDAIKGRLFAMKNNIDKYYTMNYEASNDKPSRIFISHSSKDKDYVSKIVLLLDDMGIQSSDIFCSSLPGYDIPVGTNIFEYLRRQFLEFNLHVIIIHSSHYYQSTVSMNEMGAAWVLRTNSTSFLVPTFDFANMNGAISSDTISIKMDNDEIEVKDKLNQLYNTLSKEFKVTKKPDILWEQKRDSFIEQIKRIEKNADDIQENKPISEVDDLELTENGYYIRKSESEAGKDIRYCAACYTNTSKLYPITPGTIQRDMFCTNCKMHYRRPAMKNQV